MKELVIKLTKKDRDILKDYIRKGTKKARSISRANILLLADEKKKTDTISLITKCHRQKIWSVKKRYLENGLMNALVEKPRSGQPKKYKNNHEAEIISLACTTPPVGRKRWTLDLLVEKLKRKKNFKSINRESVRLILKKLKPNHG